MCPSNDCKIIYDKSDDEYGFGGVTLKVEPNKMTINGFFKLTGSGHKGVIGLTFQCEPIDTKTTDGETTKYVCNGGSGNITPVDEVSCCPYYYDFTASFELHQDTSYLTEHTLILFNNPSDLILKQLTNHHN